MNVARKMEEVKRNQMEVIEGGKNEVSAEQRQLFETVMANLKPCGMEEGNLLTANGNVPLSLCFVDHRIQGLRKHKYLHRLETKWDIRKLTPITLVPHYEECRFSVVDGQGRYLVAPKKGLDRLQAVVLMDAPNDIGERLKFEAEYFIGQDSENEKVKSIEKHLARVIMGDRAAVILDSALHKYGADFSGIQGPRSSSVLGSYDDCYAIAKRQGEDCLEFIFSIIQNAGWNNEKNGYARHIVRSLRDTWMVHKEWRTDIHEYLSAEFRDIDPSLFLANGRSAYPRRDHGTACCLYVEDMVCRKFGIPKCIYVENGKKCVIVK